MRVFCALPPVLRKQGASSGLFLKAAALTLCLGERRKLEALKAVLHLLPDCFSEALLELEPVPLSGAQGTSGSDDSSLGWHLHFELGAQDTSVRPLGLPCLQKSLLWCSCCAVLDNPSPVFYFKVWGMKY